MKKTKNYRENSTNDVNLIKKEDLQIKLVQKYDL